MHIEKKTLRNIFIGVISCILLYWLLHETERVKSILSVLRGIFGPFLIGSGLAFILNVPMRAIENWLKRIENKRLRRSVALLLTIIAVLMILALVFWLLIPQLIETVQIFIPRLYTFISDLETFVLNFLKQNPDLINNVNLDNLNWSSLVEKALQMAGNSVSSIVESALTAIGSVSGALMDAFISVVFAVYCLFQKETLARQGRKLLYALLPEKFSDEVVRILRLTNSTFSNFLSGQCIEVCILGTLFAISMAIFRMPYIPLVSVLVAVTAFVPVVGAWIGCILGAFFIFISNPIQAVWFVIMFLVLQQIENNLIYPRVVGTSIGLPGMWVLLAVAIGGDLMGAAGMFLMIPVASVVYTLLREWINNKLSHSTVDEDKLKEQPPVLRSRLKTKIKNRKKKTTEKEEQQ